MSEKTERIEREFVKWQEEYEIPCSDEFQVKTLLELQDEYKETPKESNTVRTRENLLRMIQDLFNHLRLVKKGFSH